MTPREREDEEVFELLAHEIRVGIVSALGDASGGGEYVALPFSDLQSRVGVEDNGKFSYHLSKLDGHFIEKTDEGYFLTLPGIKVYQAIESGRYRTDVSVDPFPIDVECEDCGSGYHAWYEDGRFHGGCRECDHVAYRYPIDPGSFEPDDRESLLSAVNVRLRRDHESMLHGLCPYCSGPVELSLSFDVDVFPTPESPREGQAICHFVCQRCHWFLHATPNSVVQRHPAVQSFLYEGGIDVWAVGFWNEDACEPGDVRSTDPWRIAIPFDNGEEVREFVFDGDLDLVSSTTV